MQVQKPVLAAILFLMVGASSCDNTEIGNSSDVNQDKIYMNYSISAYEESGNVDLNFQYRFAGSGGTTLLLNEPSQIELDGEKLKADSSKAMGVFYNANKDLSRFFGKHTIVFTDFNGKKFENIFDFAPFTINAIPETVDRNKDLVISFNTLPLGTNDNVEVNSYDTDSSFHYEMTKHSSSITIPAEEFKRQKQATFSLDFELFKDIPLTTTASEGGSLKMYYRLKPIKIKLQP
ncbi:MAG: hypothetical protein ABI685_01350 [Ferruginibacter sp.]